MLASLTEKKPAQKAISTDNTTDLKSQPCYNLVKQTSEDTLFGSCFAQRLMGVPRLRLEQRFEHLAAQLPHNAVTQLGEQLGET